MRTDTDPQTAEYLDHLETKRKLAEAQDRIKAMEKLLQNFIDVNESGPTTEQRMKCYSDARAALTGKPWRRE